MPNFNHSFWKKMPVLRLLIPFFLGIIQQHDCSVPVSGLLGLLIISTSATVFYTVPLLPFSRRYRFTIINGLSIFALLAVLGSLSVWRHDVRNHPLWIGNLCKEADAFVIKLHEKPVERTNSFKAEASLRVILQKGRQIRTECRILAYFPKDPKTLLLSAGDEITTTAALQPVLASANPGGLDYQQYLLRQGITHQLFLRNDYVLTGHHTEALTQLISAIRQYVLSILSQAFPDEKQRGLAEALLIGYKNDLDKDLIQSYTNTGVVHIIAISGLHLGLIYWLLVKMLQPLTTIKRLRWFSALVIVIGLWLFTLLAGAEPSVLRSAIMFTCIVAGNTLSRRPNSYNSLALSAFILLCINPYWLWDVGFQLSYAAIIGIMVFSRPIYHLLHFSNKAIDTVWQMCAVTLSAQLLTLPVCIYHFHQFPNYFLLSNLIAVPLSSIILLLEISLCAISFIPSVFYLTAKLAAFLISLMNGHIERIEQLPFSVWNGLQIGLIQAILLSLFIILILSCLIQSEKRRILCYSSLLVLSAFLIIRCISFIHAGSQQKIIVHRGIVDFVYSRVYVSFSTAVNVNPYSVTLTRNYFRLRGGGHGLALQSGNAVSFLSRRVLHLSGSHSYWPTPNKIAVDLVILSNDPDLEPDKLSQAVNFRQVVADVTVPAWKSRNWQQYCDSAGISFHDMRTKGAFVMNL